MLGRGKDQGPPPRGAPPQVNLVKVARAILRLVFKR